MNDAPRRSGRAVTKVTPFDPSDTPNTPKARRKVDAKIDPESQLEFLLQNPKSCLTSMDVATFLNPNVWDMLSEASQERLVKLLPDTAFLGYVPTIDPSHPSARLNNGEQPMAGPSSLHMNRTRTNIDPAMPIFTDPHFLAAAHTFQDHICSGWMSAAQKDKVKQFQDGIKVLDASGGVGLAAPWKDEIWERETREEALFQTAAGNSRNGNLTSTNDTVYERLTDLSKNNILRVGDILAYKRYFPQDLLKIEKDVIIQSIHPRTHGLTVLVSPSTEQFLPGHLLSRTPVEPDAPTKTMHITSPTMLENGLLDIDGRTDRGRRVGGPNVWKSFTLWRWRDSEYESQTMDERGGRENHGTLHYLRGSYYQDPRSVGN